MLRNNIKSSWNRSNVFGRKAVYVPPSRVGDLCATTSPASSPDAEKEQSNVEDANTAVGKTANEPSLPGLCEKENILSATEPNNTVVENSDANEKRAAKRKKQKENKLTLGYDVQKLSGDNWTLEGALTYCGLGQKPIKDSIEVTEEKMKAIKHQSKQAVVDAGLEKKDAVENDSGFGDWNRHETTLGLASVKNGLITPSSELSEDSEHGKNLSECSEVISPAELDTDDILRSLVADKAAGHDFESVRMGIVSLPNTLDQQSSVTDSSGVETSSDADSDHAMYVIDAADQKSDVPNDPHGPDLLHQPEDSACEQEAEFTTVSKKRKPKSLQVDRNAKYAPPFPSTHFVSPDSGESSPHQEQTTSICQLPNSSCADHPTVHKECVKLPENRLSLGITAHTRLDSEPCVGTSFDVRHQPSGDFWTPPENSSAEVQVTDRDSMCMDNFSGRASLSDVSLDDFAFSCLLKETLEDDWTVVKSGRRSKNNVQSTVDPLSAPGENKQSVPTNVGQCSSAIREHVDHGRGKAGTNSGRGGKWSAPNSRCKSFDGSNSKTFDRCWHDNATKARPQEASRKDFFPSGVARCSSSNEPKYRDTTNCDKLSRCNSNKEASSSESNPVVPARCILGIPRFSQKSTVPKCDVPVRSNSAVVVANSSEGAKSASPAEPADDDAARDTEEGLSSEKTRLSSTEINKSAAASTNSKLPAAAAAEKTHIRHRTFNLIEAQIYLYREYQEVLKEQRKIPRLVVIYDPDSDL